MKIQLIQATLGEYQVNSRTGSYAPLGLVSIATYIKSKFPEINIEILDGELLSFDEIISEIDADIVGFNTNTVNYPDSVKMASIAKKRGAKVVFGGVYASALPQVIIENRGDIVDTVVVGYGEKPMEDIINGDSSRIIVNRKPEFNTFPKLDRSYVDMEAYINVFQNSHPTWKYRATNIFTNVGCTWKEISGKGCIFCSRSGSITYFKDPDIIWGEIKGLIENYNIDYVVDFSDTILQNKVWLQELIDKKPHDINIKWHVFSRADEINQTTIDLLKKLNCVHVFVGMESGDYELYKKTYKGGGNPDDNLKVAKLLKENNIEITPSYVLGLPGETEHTLKKTYEHALKLQEITNFEEIFCCELIPFPGSFAFSRLKQTINLCSDIFDIYNLKQDWVENFTCLNNYIVKNYTYKILNLGLYKITIDKTNHENVNNINPLIFVPCKKV